MHKGMRRKLKVYAVDAAMIFLAFQLTAVIKGGKMEIAAMPSQGVVLEEREEIQIPEGWGEPETETHDTNGSLIKRRDWSAEDAEILLKIAMAEAEGERVEGKALVMLVVLNRVWSEGFPDSISEVVFQDGQFTPTEEGGRYWNTEPDAGCYEAYEMVLHGWDESQGALYFCSSGSSRWMEENTEYLFTVGNHDFYR